MHELIAWCGFLGGWLLVAGPVFQAALELQEEQFEREAYQGANLQAEHEIRPVSHWWWLLPPLGYQLARHRARRVRDAAVAALEPQQRAALTRFLNKATGWLYVAIGGSLIATKETWELRETYEWPVAVFWVLAPAMALLCAANTTVRLSRTQHMLARPDQETASTPDTAR